MSGAANQWLLAAGGTERAVPRFIEPGMGPVRIPAVSLSPNTTRPERVLAIALVLSLALHGAASFLPETVPEDRESVPLQATLTQLPPPPKPVAVPPAAKPKPKPARPRAVKPAPRAPAPPPVAQQAVPLEPPPPPPEPAWTIEAPENAPAPPVPVIAEEHALPPPSSEMPTKTLPPRVDLVYRVFLGTQGFYVGDATYRFEHDANRYSIRTVGEARGLAALILRGQGKLESEGIITGAGLQPDWFAVERGRGKKRELAQFDWESGIVTLDDQKAEGLDLPTYDPLTFLWQFYFLPPAKEAQTFAIATTRRVYRYSFTREASEALELSHGVVEAERWHRRSEDGKTDAYVWLAPAQHYVAVKMRFVNTERGAVEAVLDAIKVDAADAGGSAP